MKDVWEYYDQLCRQDVVNGRWVVPNTQDLAAELDEFNWPQMVRDEPLARRQNNIMTIIPTWYMDEADPNHYDRPRLDLVVTFDNGPAVRYHPKSDLIWLPEDPDDEAIGKRRERLATLRRKYGRDWQR